MTWQLVSISALSAFAALVAFFCSLSLNCVLLPVCAIFVGLPEAVVMGAVVNGVGNWFRLFSSLRHVRFSVAGAVMLPAIFAAYLGASCLGALMEYPAALAGVLGGCIVAFTLLESTPKIRLFSFSPRWLLIGGALSGFVGGISGFHAVLPGLFLLRLNLNKDAFLATSVAVVAVIDWVRLFVYFNLPMMRFEQLVSGPLVVGITGALLGSLTARVVLRRISFESIKKSVTFLLIVLGVAIAFGWL